MGIIRAWKHIHGILKVQCVLGNKSMVGLNLPPTLADVDNLIKGAFPQMKSSAKV